MGTLPLDPDRILKGADKKTFLVETFTDTSSVSRPEEGCVWCNLREKGARDATFNLTVCYADWNEQWHNRWLEAFAALPDYRERFRISDEPGWKRHPTIPTHIPHLGFVEIDELLAAPIRRLTELGCRTLYSCQGVESANGQPVAGVDAPCAYITLDSIGQPFPKELQRAWEGAGFAFAPYAVHAVAPYGMLADSAILFVTSLREWLSGKLDETGGRYVLRNKRKSSLPVVPLLPQTVLETKQDQAVRALLRLGNKARFKDFAQLRSGTDKWSRVRLPALKEALGERFEGVANSGLDEDQQAKCARWILRGLPAELALRKVKTDMEVAQNAR
jgi:hypothetical protein